jgi:hypothetical protein
LLRNSHEADEVRISPLNPGSNEKDIINSFLNVMTLGHPVHYSVGDFALIKPGKSYVEDISFGFSFKRRPDVKDAGQIPGEGEYWISIFIFPWPGTQRKATQNSAELLIAPIWTEPCWSEPIRVEIRANSPLESCNSEFQTPSPER